MARTDSKLITAPDFTLEAKLIAQGTRLVAGVDEAGRGPLAGPVVVSAVILNPDDIPEGLNDSKKITPKRRDALFREIMRRAHVAVVTAPPSVIDSLNIRGATLWAMARAVAALPIAAEHALIDGRDIPPGLACPGNYVIGGDTKSVSIAAASIVAKVVRDRMCPTMDADAPGYGFAGHKGYGSAKHMEALESIGASAHHRASFAPVTRALEKAAASA